MSILPSAPGCLQPGHAQHARNDAVALTVEFQIGRLTPRGVRQRFIDSLRIAIAQARGARQIDPAVAEELWRALPSTRGQRT
jgi:hypothetical protein